MVRRITAVAQEIPSGGEALPAPAMPTATIPEVEDLAGRPFSLASLRGKVVVVDFWASWCGPCQKSFPALDRLNGRYRDQGCEVVGISLDEDRAAMAQFLERVPVGFRIAWDRTGVLARQFQIASMPTTLILNKEGRVVARFEGGGQIPKEEDAIEALLGGRTLPLDTGSTVAPGLRATGVIKAWDRGHLADPIMNLDGDPLARTLWEHIHSAKEGAAGNGGAAGGGCGCN